MKEIKKLPDNQTLDQLIDQAESFLEKTEEIYDKVSQIDQDLNVKIKTRRKETIRHH